MHAAPFHRYITFRVLALAAVAPAFALCKLVDWWREQKAKGEITPEQLRVVEDKAISEIVKFQEDAGLKSITDGEFRRTYFHIDFLEQIGGVKTDIPVTIQRPDGTPVNAVRGLGWVGGRRAWVARTEAVFGRARGRTDASHHAVVAAPAPVSIPSVLVLDREAQAETTLVGQAAALHSEGMRVRTLSLFYEEWLGKLPAGETVIFDDDHYYMGSVLAELLAQNGNRVTYLTPSTKVAEWSGNTLEQGYIQARLLELGVDVRVTRGIAAIGKSSVMAACTRTGSRLNPAGSMSANTGVAPTRAIASDVA